MDLLLFLKSGKYRIQKRNPKCDKSAVSRGLHSYFLFCSIGIIIVIINQSQIFKSLCLNVDEPS